MDADECPQHEGPIKPMNKRTLEYSSTVENEIPAQQWHLIGHVQDFTATLALILVPSFLASSAHNLYATSRNTEYGLSQTRGVD
jgi:hypothetical protein